MPRSCRRPQGPRILLPARPAPRRSADRAGRGIVRAADPSAAPAPYAETMTALEPRIPTPPCVRSTRQWLIALAHSALGTALGLLLLLISFGALLAEFSDQPPAGLVGMYGVDALIGVLATVLSGPLRFLPPGRLHTAAHLLLAAAVGLSLWAMPAAALALSRLGVRRTAVLDVGGVPPRHTCCWPVPSASASGRCRRLRWPCTGWACGAGPCSMWPRSCWSPAPRCWR